MSAQSRTGADQWASVVADDKMSASSGRTVMGCEASVLGKREIEITYSTGIKVEIPFICADGQKKMMKAFFKSSGNSREQAETTNQQIYGENRPKGPTLALQ